MQGGVVPTDTRSLRELSKFRKRVAQKNYAKLYVPVKNRRRVSAEEVNGIFLQKRRARRSRSYSPPRPLKRRSYGSPIGGYLPPVRQQDLPFADYVKSFKLRSAVRRKFQTSPRRVL